MAPSYLPQLGEEAAHEARIRDIQQQINSGTTTSPSWVRQEGAIVSGVSWYDQNGQTVSAHGANIILDGGRYYLFGEYKTDSASVFTGFSCYSSDNLVDWHFERIAFSRQDDGRMGPGRVGERPKVLRCLPTTCDIMTPAPAMPRAAASLVLTSFRDHCSTKGNPSSAGT